MQHDNIIVVAKKNRHRHGRELEQEAVEDRIAAVVEERDGWPLGNIIGEDS